MAGSEHVTFSRSSSAFGEPTLGREEGERLRLSDTIRLGLELPCLFMVVRNYLRCERVSASSAGLVCLCERASFLKMDLDMRVRY
jgi:hypothetical protein